MKKEMLKYYKKIRNRKCIILLRFLLKKTDDILFYMRLNYKVKKIRRRYNKCVFLMATPCHGNLGDHAIVWAEFQMLKQCGLYNQTIEISNEDYFRYRSVIKNIISTDDIIIIDGGGSLGTLWPVEDDKISEIIETYCKNKIIVFPQTCFYDKSPEASDRLLKNKAVYQNAENLLIALRDKKSYEFCINYFENTHFEFIPDIVLSLSIPDIEMKTGICGICFREDKERVLDDLDKNKIYNYLFCNKICHKKTTTIYDKNIKSKERIQILREFLNRYAKYQLILTDRLHAMIFAAITGTPCLALDNKSKKVSGVYDWISHLPYIKVCNSVDEMISNISMYYKMNENIYEKNNLEIKFNVIREYLTGDDNWKYETK